GHHCSFCPFSVIDSLGTTRIGNGVGARAHRQLWTHMYSGDLLHGCRFGSHRPLVIEDDVWFVGHCVVSPIRARARSMAMVGSVVTKDMDADQIYSGVPATNMTARFGPQYREVALGEKRPRLESYLR